LSILPCIGEMIAAFQADRRQIHRHDVTGELCDRRKAFILIVEANRPHLRMPGPLRHGHQFLDEWVFPHYGMIMSSRIALTIRSLWTMLWLPCKKVGRLRMMIGVTLNATAKMTV
jgi:hypothetical protein